MKLNTVSFRERTQRLRSYLARISPERELENTRSHLEASIRETVGGAELELKRSGDSGDEESMAMETLDVLIRGDLDDIAPDRLNSLEAIIHKTERPAVDIINGTFRPPPAPCRNYWLGDTKRRLEKVIPSIGGIELPNDLRGRPYGGTGVVVSK